MKCSLFLIFTASLSFLLFIKLFLNLNKAKKEKHSQIPAPIFKIYFKSSFCYLQWIFSNLIMQKNTQKSHISFLLFIVNVLNLIVKKNIRNPRFLKNVAFLDQAKKEKEIRKCKVLTSWISLLSLIWESIWDLRNACPWPVLLLLLARLSEICRSSRACWSRRASDLCSAIKTSLSFDLTVSSE